MTLFMYHQHFGLREPPFSIAVNPRYLFMSPRHRDALAHLLYGVSSGGGFILLTGEVGTGKTTVNRCLLEQLPDTTDVAIILNPALSAVELLATACDELGISYPETAPTLKQLTDALHRFLLENHEAGRRTVLMIDEAQHLDFDVLEQIRLLTNLETHDQKLLQIILIGQPELSDKLARPELRQLNQRITARYHLEPLNADETGAYIRHRLEVAGLPQGQSLFSPGVVRDIHRRTRGIPRLINLLCDRTLLGAYGQRRAGASKKLVRDAAAEVLGAAAQRQLGSRLLGLLLLLIVAAILVALAFIEWPATGVEAVTDKGIAVQAPIASPPQQQQPSWLMPLVEAESALWRLTSDDIAPRNACPELPVADLQCVEANAATWDSLVALERPVLLLMQRPDRFAGGTLILEIRDRVADVWDTTGIRSLPLADLARYWTGEVRYWWRVPEGWQGPVAVGERGAVVAAVAAMFARLDGQQQPLTDELFTAALETRVKIFQQGEGLSADGVVGERTLQRLNSRLGRALDSDRARRRLSLLSAER
jgi:general secretion pathway protein A